MVLPVLSALPTATHLILTAAWWEGTFAITLFTDRAAKAGDIKYRTGLSIRFELGPSASVHAVVWTTVQSCQQMGVQRDVGVKEKTCIYFLDIDIHFLGHINF